MLQAAGLADHTAHGHGQTGGGNHQKDVVNFIGGAEIAKALLSDNGIEGNLVKRTHQLDNYGGRCQQRCALQEILLFLLCHYFASVMGSSFWKSLGMVSLTSSSTTLFRSMVGNLPF